MLGAALAVMSLLGCLSAVPPARAQETPYEVEITGVEDDELRDLLEATGSLFRLQDRPPPSPVGLRRRAEADREALTAALRSLGYYESDIDMRIDTEAEPAQVTVAVEPGPRYRIDDVSLVGPVGQPLPELDIGRDELGLEHGTPARARAVVAAEAAIETRLAARGHAFAEVTDREVVIDRADQTMDVTFLVDPGPRIRLGEVRIQGLDTVEEEAVRRRIEWRPGALYDPALIEELREDVAELGTFSAVRVELAEEPGPEGVTPLTIVVEERPLRVIGFGVELSSTEGLGANAYWGHRNLFGGAESLNVALEVSGIGADVSADTLQEVDVGAEVEYREPDFLLRDQALILQGRLLREETEAYIREAAVASALLELEVGDDLTLGYGVLVEETRIREEEDTTISTLLGVPLTLAWDASDDILNPTTGFRIDAALTPFKQFGGDSSNFVVGRLINTAYYDVGGDGDWVLAGRLSIGSIYGAEVEEIPAHLRFYAGGGGSVRGFGFQQVGPRDAFGDPRGGLSLFEASAELRIKVTETIGIVPFVDAGNVYDTVLPSFGRDLKWGAGLGLRYFTGFGPLRADVAVPLNREPGDDTWAFYLSIGQAF